MRRQTFSLSIAAAGLLLLPGCLTSSQTKSLQTDIDAIQAQMLQLQREHATLQEQLQGQAAKITAALQERQESQRVERADVAAGVESLSVEMDVLGAKLDDTNYRLSSLGAEIQAAREAWSRAAAGAPTPSEPPDGSGTAAPPVGSTPPRPVVTGGASPDEIFNTAYADYTKGNYPLAILGFQEYLEKFPETDFSDDALYWIGESYYSQGKFGDAADAFGEVSRRYPGSDKVASADLKRGYALLESNQTPQGVVQLNALIEAFPSSDEARLARERLRALGLQDR